MRTLVFSTAVIAGVVWMGMAPANAAPPSMSGIDNENIKVGTVKNIGYWRRLPAIQVSIPASLNDGHLRMLSPPSRRLPRCEAVLRSSLQLLEFAQDPLPKS